MRLEPFSALPLPRDAEVQKVFDQARGLGMPTKPIHVLACEDVLKAEKAYNIENKPGA